MRQFFLGLAFIFAVLFSVFALCYFVGCGESKSDYREPTTARHAFGAVVLDRDASTYYNPPEIKQTSWRE